MTAPTPTNARELSDYTSPPTTVADAIDRVARLDALSRWLTGLRDEVRGWLDTEADRHRDATGTAARWPVKGLGRAHKTDPDPRVTVADRDAFGAWYAAAYPNRVELRTVAEVVVDDPDALAQVAAGLRLLLADEPDDVTHVRIRADVARTIATGVHTRQHTDRYLPADALDQLRTDPRFREVAGLGLVDTDTGEPVPGVTVTDPPPGVVSVTIDTAAKQRLDAELATILGPPQLDRATDATEVADHEGTST